MEGMYLKTGLKLYENMAKFWIKIFALIFGIGVATGIVMEFLPTLVLASNDISNSITIKNGASSFKTMKTLLLIAAIGTPLVGVYTIFVFLDF
ncbi:MAG: hypothetical protein RLZZ196_372 [Bacteroidota bacterium]|jgi:cytochrome bd-type quinol oxidase subunit 2